jgi:hypothetical protein
MMQVRFDADITNDGTEAVILLDGYVKGTKPKVPFMRKIDIPPTTTITDEINRPKWQVPAIGQPAETRTE